MTESLPDRLRTITHTDTATRVGELLDILSEAAAALDAMGAERDLMRDQVRKFVDGGVDLCREADGRAEAAEAECERLTELLGRYGRHPQSCALIVWAGKYQAGKAGDEACPCDCGLGAALETK